MKFCEITYMIEDTTMEEWDYVDIFEWPPENNRGAYGKKRVFYGKGRNTDRLNSEKPRGYNGYGGYKKNASVYLRRG